MIERDTFDTRMRVLLAEDHELVRDGVKLLLSQPVAARHICVVAETGSGSGILSLLSSHPIDLLIMDLGMPQVTGSAWIRALRIRYPSLRIVVMTANRDDRTRLAVLATGVDAFLPKQVNAQTLVGIIVKLHQESLPRRMMRGAHAHQQPASIAPAESLTSREQQVLSLIARGATSSEMAKRLFISPLTIRKHRENLMRKLDVHNTAELVSYALRLGVD